MATEEEIRQTLGVGMGSIGPVNLPLQCIVDHSARALSNFVCGANEDGVHFKDANWGRDVDVVEVADLRDVVEGDLAPDGKGRLKFAEELK